MSNERLLVYSYLRMDFLLVVLQISESGDDIII